MGSGHVFPPKQRRLQECPTAQTTIINSGKGERVTLDAFDQAILDVTEKSASVNITQRILVIA